MNAIDEPDRSALYTLQELMDAAGELAVARIAHMRPAVEALHRELDHEVVFSVADAIQHGANARDPVTHRLMPVACLLFLMTEVWHREDEILKAGQVTKAAPAARD
jgi:hypothetical protein